MPRFPFSLGAAPAAKAPALPLPPGERSRRWQVVQSFLPVTWDHQGPEPMAYQRIERAVASAWVALELPRTLWSKVP